MRRGSLRGRRCSRRGLATQSAVLAARVAAFAVLLLDLLATLSPAAASAAAKKPIDWLSLEEGLARVRESRLPALVRFVGEGEKDAWLAPIDDSLDRLLKRLVPIRLEPADLEKPYPLPGTPAKKEEGKEAVARRAVSKLPPDKRKKPPPLPPEEEEPGKPRPVGDVWRLLPGTSCLLWLDFRERPVRRFEGALPRQSVLKKQLTRFAKQQALVAAEASRVEKALAQSRALHEKSRQRQAVMLVVGLEEPAAQRKIDGLLRKKVQVLVDAYRDLAQEKFDEADRLEKKADMTRPRLESEQLYQKALSTYDKLIEDFPFADLVREANRRKGEILSKLTFTVP